MYFIMGSNNCNDLPEKVLQEAIDGGITLFQYREKGKGSLVGKNKLELARRLQNICKQKNIPFLVNDDIDLALEINADGVHIGQEDTAADVVRKHIGRGKILGVSVHNIDEAKKAILDGADYLGLGPIFSTKTKEDANDPQGFKFIKELRDKGIKTPIVGIGGITETNAREVILAGADGISVITAITEANSIKVATKSLAKQVKI
ncbi:MAG: thiE [Bacillales bacterium]|jgi:thiamine-phosphate pyrophosphorylase|nr:thiE [Bacillales bacterium]